MREYHLSNLSEPRDGRADGASISQQELTMHRNTFITGAALALTMVGGTVASAQRADRPDRPRGEQSDSAQRGEKRGQGHGKHAGE